MEATSARKEALQPETIGGFTRPSAELLQKVRTYTTPELCDGMTTLVTMDHTIKPWIGDQKIVGPAFPVQLSFGAGGLVPRAIELAQPGDVLVLAGQGNCQTSLWGDHRSLCAGMKRLAGVVVDGAFRDLDECREIGFPIFARALTCGSASKNEDGAIGIAVNCGGVVVQPGDIVVGDANGVCVISPYDILEVMQRAAQKIEAQKAVFEEMKRTGRIIPRVRLK